MEKYGFFNAFKDLFKYSKENKKQYIIGLIFMIIFVITSMIFTTMYSKLVANIMSLNLDKAVKLVIICGILRIFSITFCHNRYRTIVISVGEKISATIQKKIYSKVLNLSMTSLENMQSGKIFTTALDNYSKNRIEETINKLSKIKTILIIVHSLDIVQDFDNIIMIDNGKISEQGSHEQLINNHGMYYNLVNA